LAKAKSQAFDIKESALKGTHADVTTFEELGQWLARELDNGLESRGSIAAEIRDNWTRYEQGRTRGSNAPWPDAADLTSPIVTEFVDALHSRVMDTIFSDRIWTVEGWGESASKAPFVEEFHQRAAEEERLQDVLDEALLRSWNEPAAIIEVSEAVDWRREIKKVNARLQMDPMTGTPIIGEDNQPVAERDEQGDFVEARPQEPAVQMEVDSWEPVRIGPDYDVIPYLEFLTLPAHARNRSQVWGYAKFFWRRVPELKAKAKKGIYDAKVVEELGEDDERMSDSETATRTDTIVPEQKGPTSQKRLAEVQFLADLDGKGERWYRATVHRDKRKLLRLKFDDRTTRYIRFVPYKKPGSIDGYTLSGHKLLTVQEEDTAVRNMRADMAALAIAAPILRRQGALWDPYEQPFGPRSVIDVRDPQELTQLQLRDVPQSINVWKQDVRMDADRLVGQNDTSLGVDSGEDNTLGEERLRAGYAEVRVNLLIKRLKEPMEELWQARHTIWKKTLQSQAAGTLPIVQRVAIGMQANGLDISSVADGRVSPDMLEGQFWGKPKGSVETADRQRQRADFNQTMQALPALLQVWPMLAAMLNTPTAAKAVLERLLQVNAWPDKQAFLGSEAQQAMMAQFQQQQMMQNPLMQLAMGMAQAGPNGAPSGPMGAPMGGAPMSQNAPPGVQ
jgi:hypothetical protein